VHEEITRTLQLTGRQVVALCGGKRAEKKRRNEGRVAVGILQDEANQKPG
jgi:hypothetical protein